jgi:hypothetical protein
MKVDREENWVLTDVVFGANLSQRLPSDLLEQSLALLDIIGVNFKGSVNDKTRHGARQLKRRLVTTMVIGCVRDEVLERMRARGRYGIRYGSVAWEANCHTSNRRIDGSIS